jgi:hypothetical protein
MVLEQLRVVAPRAAVQAEETFHCAAVRGGDATGTTVGLCLLARQSR